MLKNIKNKIKVFTIIEALVSVAIILLIIIGPLSLTIGALNSVKENGNRIIASYLAEEIIEEFKNYRDDFALTCSNLTINYDSSDLLADMSCGSIPVNSSFYNSTIPPDTNPQNIAWKLFVNNVMGDMVTNTRQDLLLDDNSFNSLNQFIFYTPDICDKLFVSKNEGYGCSSFSDSFSTIFHRAVTLTKVSSDTIKIEVKVDYTNSAFLGNPKSIYVVDYIYKR